MRRHNNRKVRPFGGTLGFVLAATALPAGASNLLENPGFESPNDSSGGNTDTTATGWTFYGSCVRANYQNHTPDGEWSIWEQTNSSNGGIYQNVALSGDPLAGDPYTLGCYYYFENAAPTVPNLVCDLALTFLNASNMPVGPVDANGYSDATYIPSSAISTTGSWVPFSVTGIAPAGATQVQASLDFTGGSTVAGEQRVFVDDADLEPGEPHHYPAQWAVAGSGDWNESANWTSGTVPNGASEEADFFGSPGNGAATVFANTAVTVGLLRFNSPNEYVISGAGSLTFSSASSSVIEVDQGTEELDLPITLASNTAFEVAAGATLIIANPLTIDGGVTLTQTGAGTVAYQSIINLLSGASIAFDGSTRASQLSLVSGNSASIVGAGTVLEVDSLFNGGTLDVEKGKLLIDYGGSSGGSSDPIASIRAELASGYAGGRWNGAGINSLAIADNPRYGVGYADSADPGNPAGLGPGIIEVEYALYGDINLDGVVNATDLSILAASFGRAVSGWDEGDFNYDGLVNGADFGLLASNFGEALDNATTKLPASDYAALDAFAAANGLMADVPEPSAFAFAAWVGVSFLRRRCRR